MRLLTSPNTYGVEFDSTEIDAALAGGPRLAHRDFIGHGTHVAGIAAGGTNFMNFENVFVGNADLVGVAPEADIIAVKYFDLPEKLFYKLPDGSAGAEVTWGHRFADSLVYCLRTAAELGKPIVINMSFGNISHPGDALDSNAYWMDRVFDPAPPPADPDFPVDSFPAGAIAVKASGNDGGDDQRAVGRVTVPASGEIVVPFKLIDDRRGSQMTRRRGEQVRHKPTLSIWFWYRRPDMPLSVAFAVRSPHQPNFSTDVMAGGTLELGIEALAGPPPVDNWLAFAPDIHRIKIAHEDRPRSPIPAAGWSTASTSTSLSGRRTAVASSATTPRRRSSYRTAWRRPCSSAPMRYVSRRPPERRSISCVRPRAGATVPPTCSRA